MTRDALDRPGAVREGEELDATALEAYLEEALPDLDGPLTIEQFPSGFSNLTYMLRKGERELVLRRPPFGSRVRSAHDMGREYRVLAALVEVYPKVPRPLAYCDDESVLGAPFYLMERVSGVILRPRLPAHRHPAPAEMTRVAGALVDTLAELHAVDYAAAGLADLGRPEGYARRQVDGWTKRYARARTDHIPEMEKVAAWLDDRVPEHSSAALVHNDFKYDNLVLDREDLGRVVAVLDWEMATLGDPLMDLGTSLGYWVDPDDPPAFRALELSPTTLPGNLSRLEVAERYAAASGRAVDDLTFYYVFGLFKIAVIIQQIYYRYKAGHTRDERFAGLIDGVRAGSAVALEAARLGRIDRLFSG